MKYREAFDFLIIAHEARMYSRNHLFIMVELQPDDFHDRQNSPEKYMNGHELNFTSQDRSVPYQMLKHTVIFVQKANVAPEYEAEVKCRQAMNPFGLNSYRGQLREVSHTLIIFIT